MGMMTKEVKTIFIPDVHVPYQSDYALNRVLDMVDSSSPNKVVLLGDFLDCYHVSRYEKTMGHPALHEEVAIGRKKLKAIRESAGDADILYLEGNHEQRVEKYVVAHASGLEGLKEVTVPELLHLSDYGITWIPFGAECWVDGYRAEHGDCVASKSGVTAHKMLERRGCSGVSAHTHRLGHVFHTNYSHSEQWVEAGCLVDFKAMSYYVGVGPNWQWGVAYTTGDGGLHITEIKKKGS